jgi:hypothetical protein
MKLKIEAEDVSDTLSRVRITTESYVVLVAINPRAVSTSIQERLPDEPAAPVGDEEGK